MPSVGLAGYVESPLSDQEDVESRALAYEHFADRIGESFCATLGSGEHVHLRLIEATERERQQRIAWGFSLLFRVDPDIGVLPQQLVQLEHPGVGVHSLFMVPIDRDDQGTVYEVLFSVVPDADT